MNFMATEGKKFLPAYERPEAPIGARKSFIRMPGPFALFVANPPISLR